VRAVEADLVDGLCRADVAQLGRAVGGEQQQREAREGCLDDGREEVGRRGTGGADEADGAAGLPRETEGEVAGRALIEVEPRAQ